MINVDLYDNSVSILVDGKQSKVMVELCITIVKLAGDNPETINTIKEFLKLLDNDLKKGLDASTIINCLMGSYYKIGGKDNG
jgi:hypothetical protein